MLQKTCNCGEGNITFMVSDMSAGILVRRLHPVELEKCKKEDFCPVLIPVLATLWSPVINAVEMSVVFGKTKNDKAGKLVLRFSEPRGRSMRIDQDVEIGGAISSALYYAELDEELCNWLEANLKSIPQTWPELKWAVSVVVKAG